MENMSLKKGLLAAGIAAAMFAATASAQDIQAQRLYAQSLAATCANCHGTNGVSAPGATMPVINQLSSSVMYEQLQAYKTGARTGTIMHQLAKGYTDEQLKIIAEVLGKKN
jgi:sulfide dehydrogenase cytochrome subunit